METENPYKATSARIEDHFIETEVAGKGRRFGTLIVDYILYFFVCAILGAVVAVLFGTSAVEGARGYLISIPTFILYYVGFEYVLARTPGKFIFGTRVVSESGNQPTLAQVIGRTFSRLIPFEAFSLLFSGSNLGWHDTLPKTRVVTTRTGRKF